MRRALVFTTLCAAVAAGCGDGPTPTSPSSLLVIGGSDPANPGGASTVGYVQDIKPLLDGDCVQCHGPSRREHNVDVSTFANVLRNLQPGNVNSVLIRETRNGGSMYWEWTGDRAGKAELVRRWIVEFQAREPMNSQGVTMRALAPAVAAAMLGAILPGRAAAADASSFAVGSVVFGDAENTATDAALDAKVWRVDFGAPLPVASVTPRLTLDAPAPIADLDAQSPVRRPVAYTYSDAYTLRAKIRKYSSFLTLPLFGGQYLLGTKLDNGTGGESVRWTHAAIATTMAVLFTVNTVTGVWNLLEGRANPAGRTRRLVHAVLMLASDAGFVATGLLAPTNDGGGNRSLHKSVAITSMGVASAGYLLMLFGQ